MPKKKTYGFKDKHIAEQLKQLVGDGDGQFPTPGGKSPNYILQAPAGGIAGKSGSTISWATCTVQGITGFTGTTSGTATLGSASITLPVFNLSVVAVAANAIIIAIPAGGWLVCNWEDC